VLDDEPGRMGGVLSDQTCAGPAVLHDDFDSGHSLASAYASYGGGRPVINVHQLEADLSYRLGEFGIPINLAKSLYAGQRFLKHEPERSQRALRLLFANWLAHVEIPELRQQRPAVRAILAIGTSASSIPLYPVGALAPAGALAMSPRDVATWLVSTKDAKKLL
jgi:hypothetical protein